MKAYRADIDGLRAVAVLSVVSFHLKFGAPGGFVGVDVFFVLSGFLISRIIYSEVLNGSFSIFRFYERRARRILPALFTVMVGSSIAAMVVFYPSELVTYSKSAIASALFYANVYFFSVDDYFGPTADTIPLLHLWSLGIEEQFYIVFPLLVLLFRLWSWRAVNMIVICLCAASLLASQLMVGTDPAAAFYLLPYRGFELLIGCIIALPKFEQQPRSRALRETAAAIGLACLIGAVVTFGPETEFPGVAALLPCFGTAMIIWTGGTARTSVSTVLSIRPLVYIGKISFSLYLVHWPVFGLWASSVSQYFTNVVCFANGCGLTRIGCNKLQSCRAAL